MTDEKWRKAWELFCDAQILRGEERDKLLAAAGADPELEAEVHALFQASRSCSMDGRCRHEQGKSYAAGEEIGHYTIIGPIGRGASGEVYAGRDRNLGRTVALKVLDQSRWGDKSSFSQEARTVSALNHPNILTIYEFIETGDQFAIVMEFVEGTSLRSLCDAPMPLEVVARYGNQIAQALLAAHNAGIVHRDVKPENIIVRPDGYVKLLDFGLARSFQDAMNSGVAGTLRYMSPEQVRGEPVRASSDVFSLGLVLYELSTGAHPFPESNPLAAADAIVERPAVAPSRRNDKLPSKWDRLVLAILSKDQASRPTIAQVASSLEAIYSTKPPKRIGMLAIAAMLLLATLLLFAYRWPRTSGIRLTTSPLTGQGGQERFPALSPDGRFAVYSWRASQNEPVQVLLQEVGSDRVTRLAIMHEGNFGPFTWTPDGKRIGFYLRSGNSGSFRVVNTDGTREEKLLDLSPSTDHSFSWSPDGQRLAFSDFGRSGATSRIFLYSLANRQRTQLTSPPESYNSDLYPAFSPDGSQVAFRRYLTMSDGDVWLVEVRAPDKLRRLTNDHTRGEAIVWTADGRAVISATGVASRAGLWFYPIHSPDTPQRLTELGMQTVSVTSALRKQRLAWVNAMDDTNLWRARVSGGPAVRVVASAMRDNDVNCSREGLLAFRSERSGESEIWISDAAGNSQTRATNLGGFTGSPRWSPDGRRIVFDSRPKNGDPRILVVDCLTERMQCGAPVRLTHESAPNALPNWSADGRYIYFASQKTNAWQLWKVPSTGGDPVQVTSKGGYFAYESPDGKTLYYSRVGNSEIQGVWRKSLTGTPNPDDEGKMILPLPYAATATWVLFGHEIFYETFSSNAQPSEVRAYDLNTGRQRIVHKTDKPLARGLSVSPDGGFVYFAQTDRAESNIVIADYQYSR